MSSTFNLTAKGWFAIGLVVYILGAFAISTGQFVAAITDVCALIWYSIVRVRIAHDTMPVRLAFVQNPT